MCTEEGSQEFIASGANAKNNSHAYYRKFDSYEEALWFAEHGDGYNNNSDSDEYQSSSGMSCNDNGSDMMDSSDESCNNEQPYEERPICEYWDRLSIWK